METRCVVGEYISRATVRVCRLDATTTGYRRVAEFCDYGNALSDSIEGVELLSEGLGVTC